MREKFQWPDEENINLTETFLAAHDVHQWIYEHEGKLVSMNYLKVECLGFDGEESPEGRDNWAASFDCGTDNDPEWYEHLGRFQYAAVGACVEEAILRAALKAKAAIERVSQ